MADVGDDQEKTKAKAQRGLRLVVGNESAIENGRLALHAFRQWPEERNLEKNDLRAIAENLNQMLDEFKTDGGVYAKLFEEAGLSPNEKARMTQKKGAPLNKELRVKKKQYLVLLEKWSGQDIGNEISLLAERMLRDTQFYPLDRADLEDARLIMRALQVAVDRIDREFNLWEMCQAVADIREPLEAPYKQAVEGDEAALSKFFDENPCHTIGEPIRLWWPVDEDRLQDDEGRYLLPDNAFWVKSRAPYDPSSAGAWSGEEIFFFPHVYLGPAIEWRVWTEYRDGIPQAGMSDSSKESVISEVQAAPDPYVLFNRDAGTYQVYVDHPETGERVNAIDDWDWGGGSASDNACRWLVIYPDQDAERLVPAIYMRGTYSVTELRPLSETLIAEWGDRDRWQYLGRDGADTLLQRMKNLTGFGTHDFKVLDAWRETAARFHLNPIFRNHQDEADKVLYRRQLKNWIAQGQRILEEDE